METTSLWSCIYLLVVVYSLAVFFSTVYNYDAVLYFLVFVFSMALFIVSLALLFVVPQTLFYIFVLLSMLIYSLLVFAFLISDDDKSRLVLESVVHWISLPIAFVFALLLGMSIFQIPIAL